MIRVETEIGKQRRFVLRRQRRFFDEVVGREKKRRRWRRRRCRRRSTLPRKKEIDAKQCIDFQALTKRGRVHDVDGLTVGRWITPPPPPPPIGDECVSWQLHACARVCQRPSLEGGRVRVATPTTNLSGSCHFPGSALKRNSTIFYFILFASLSLPASLSLSLTTTTRKIRMQWWERRYYFLWMGCSHLPLF